MHQNQIALPILQEVLESASNAAAKGQAQYFTPPNIAARAARHLPDCRPFICDLTCGAGSLLQSADLFPGGDRSQLLGCDIDSCPAPASQTPIQRITGDVTKLFPLLVEVGWRCDLFTLNPPWDLHWYREPLKDLGESETPAVREAFAQCDPRLPAHNTIDSTVATIMMALDRCTYRGEGYVLAYPSTMERLIFAPDAPYRALAAHFWKILPLDPASASASEPAPYSRRLNPPDQPAATPPVEAPAGRWHAYYFAKAHESGPGGSGGYRARITYAPHAFDDSAKLWKAAGEEYKIRYKQKVAPYNLMLKPNGAIAVYLSVFAQESQLADKEKAQRLFKLRGTFPMQLVLQRNTRQDLLDALSIWTVDPLLRRAVDEALRSYAAARAPLYPLPKTQRLGYLDEEDTILCTESFTLQPPHESEPSHFEAGQRYPLSSKTMKVERYTWRTNLEGIREHLLLTGQELVFTIRHPSYSAHFMSDPAQAPDMHAQPLPVLLDHFDIPDVPDVAKVHPEAYQANLDKLTKLEQFFVQ